MLYKPLMKRAHYAVGFGEKIILDPFLEQPSQTQPTHPEIQKMKQHIGHDAVGVLVKKEALIHKFPTTPTIKMELARLEIGHKIYFSLCVDGKSLELVETISRHLLGEHISCDYVSFLKNILKS